MALILRGINCTLYNDEFVQIFSFVQSILGRTIFRKLQTDRIEYIGIA